MMMHRTAYLLLLLSLHQHTTVYAQCTDAFSLGPDTALCAGSTITLSAGGGYQSYLWSTGSTAPSISTGQAGTYTCTVTDFGASGELVVNGNFQQGATGFTSDYVPGYGGTYGLLSGSATYATTTSPNLVHNNFYAFNDHTGGGGNMLVVNGAEVPGQNVWCQSIAVAPNTSYAFSAWLATAFPESPAQLVFTINGNIIGTPLNAPFNAGQWLNFYSIWNSGANTTATICISNQNSANSGNDFALDDISFAPFCTYTDQVVITIQNYPQPDLGDDVSVCEGTAVLLDGTWPGADAYDWQNGTGNATLPTSASGTYWVDVTENGCTTRDSVDVAFSPLPLVDLGDDLEQCAGNVVMLDASVAGATYTWQDGSTLPTYQVSGTGQVSVTVDLNGCTASDEVNFQYFPIPLVDLGPDTSICADTVLQVSIARPGGSYIWEDGSTGAARTLQGSGLYHVTVTVNGCSGSDSLDLGTIPLPHVDLGPDFLLCEGRTAVLDATGAGLTYLWSTGDTTAELTITEEGVYLITVGNPCGTLADSVKVEQDRCDCPVFLPNAFTPDGDGLNEFFRPQFDCDIDRYVLRVFDRWGLEVWSSEDRLEAWDGEGTPNGIYAWALEIRPVTVNDRTLRKLFGHVVLIR
jgi:gliding motility-associated-like protein